MLLHYTYPNLLMDNQLERNIKALQENEGKSRSFGMYELPFSLWQQVFKETNLGTCAKNQSLL